MSTDRDPQFPEIPFSRPALTGDELDNVEEAIRSGKIGPGGPFTRKCQGWLTERFDVAQALVTGSCTAALEIAALLLDLGPGDEVIMPSFGYPSTANAVVRTGATAVFIDLEPDTMNLSPTALANAVSDRTRAVVVIHYGGIACDMDRILSIAEERNLAIIEDAAQAFLAGHRGRMCGILGTFGCFSFHESKNIHCGQGGALLINRPEYTARAEIVLEKGTNRRQFLRKEVDRYTWQDVGSSYAIEDLRAAFLLPQLQHGSQITNERVSCWWRYHRAFSELADSHPIQVPRVPEYAEINGHTFWLTVESEHVRDQLIDHLRSAGMHAVFHYVPLHSAMAGRRFGRFAGKDIHTTRSASQLVRLPIYQGFDATDRVVDQVRSFLQRNPGQP